MERSSVHQGVQKNVIAANQPLKNAGDDKEEVRRQGRLAACP
jgi:hypothetical protein